MHKICPPTYRLILIFCRLYGFVKKLSWIIQDFEDLTRLFGRNTHHDGGLTGKGSAPAQAQSNVNMASVEQDQQNQNESVKFFSLSISNFEDQGVSLLLLYCSIFLA
jgi:hypothetical protein